MNAFDRRLRREVGELSEALRSARFYGTLLATLAGCLVSSVAINAVLIPRGLFSPGTTGTSLLLIQLTKWPLGVTYALLNVPIFLIGWREYALKYVVISMFGVGSFSVMMSLTKGVTLALPDPLMASIVAGVMMGAGTGFYLRFGGSAGGLDILATFIRKKVGVPIGFTCNAVNAANLLGALLIFDLSTAFYSAVLMWVSTWTLEAVQSGLTQHRAVFVITRHHEAMAARIRERLKRGVTFLSATGSYSGQPLQVVYCVINMYELGRLKDIVFQTDSAAYVMVTDASEVIGRRFQSWEQEGYRPPSDAGAAPLA